jgi:hypothetical protein
MGILDTVILDLVPTSFRLYIDSESDERLILLGAVSLKRGESVQLTTGEDFNKLAGTLRLLEHEFTESEKDEPIGSMRYYAESKSDLIYQKAGYQLDVKISRNRLEPLLQAIHTGRLPAEISIRVAGMKYDWQPDGSGKLWDNETSRAIPVESIDFITPLIGEDRHNLLDDRIVDDAALPTRAQFNELLAKINRSNRVLICLMVVAVLLLIVTWLGH